MPTDPNDPSPSPQVQPIPDLTNSTQQAQRAKDSIDQLSGSASNFNTILDAMVIGLGGSTRAFDNFAQHTQNIQTFNNQLDQLGNYSQVAGTLLRKLAAEATGNNAAFTAGINVVSSFVSKMADAADNALKLEHGYLQIAGATGLMGQVFETAGPHLLDINKNLQDYGTMMNDVAKSTNTSLSSVSDMYRQMATTVPESTTQQVQATEGAAQTTNALEAAMKLAAGTSGDFGQVLKGLKTGWEDYNLSGQKALEFTARMSDLSEKFHINLEYTQGFLEREASAFKMISNGATDVDQSFNRMFQSFRDTGLSAKQSTDLIGGLTEKMSNLTTAQKAFLSAQTGGPGGLRGAFQIDQMLREGKVDEVLQKVEQNLRKQFGGKIYTQEEAGQSDQAASQYVKQRALLQSGAFGGLVDQGPKGDAQAARILEAMKNGTSAAQELRPAQKTLTDSIARGEDVQKQSNTILGDQLRELQKLTTLAEINSLDKIQKYLGNTERTDRGISGGILQNQANLLNQNQKKSSVQANEISGVINRKNHIDGSEERSNIGKNIGDQVKSHIPQAFQDAFSQVQNNLFNKKETEAPEFKSVRAETSAAAVAQATNSNKQIVQNITNVSSKSNSGRPGDAPVPIAQKQQVDIRITGVICDTCGKTVHQNPHTQIITGGTGTHN